MTWETMTADIIVLAYFAGAVLLPWPPRDSGRTERPANKKGTAR